MLPSGAALWSAPQKLVQAKWESVGRLSHGGTHHEETTDRRPGGAGPSRSRSRSGQGPDDRRRLSEDRRGPDHLLPVATATRPRPGRQRPPVPRAGDRGRSAQAAGGRADARQADAPGHRKKKVVSPIQQRAAADYLSQEYGVSQRRISRVMGRSRSTLRYVRRTRGD